MFPHNRNLYVIIVHYGPSAQAAQTIAAVQESSLIPEHIVVVDHAKQPFQTDPHPRTTTIRPKQNEGYAAGINIGLGALAGRGIAASDTVVVMNSDVRVHRATFAGIASWWATHPGEALLGAVVLEGKERTGLGYVNLWTGRTHLTSPSSRVASRHFWRLPYVHGAFFAAPYGALLAVGSMPTAYFLYWEDVLLSALLQRHGVPPRVASSVTIDHHRHKSATAREQQLYYLVRNGALFLEHHTPRPWRAWWWVANRARLLYHTLRPQRSEIVRRALYDAARGRTGKKELL